MSSRAGPGPARHAVIAATFLACAIALGGGGSPNPATEIVLQLLFVLAALAWLWTPGPGGTLPLPRQTSVWLVCALALILPLAQLVPLPASVWTGLAGQEDRAAALALVGREASWQPLSLAPSLTLASLLAIVPALFAFAATAALDARGRLWLVGVVTAMALLTAVIGAVQVSLGNEGFNLYRQFHPRVVTGFQANRNAAADVLLIGMAAAAAFVAPSLAPSRPSSSSRGRRRTFAVLADRRAAGIFAAIVLDVLFFATVLTMSRTGIALIPLAMIGVWIILRPSLADLGAWRFLPVAAAAVLAVAVVGVMLAGNTNLANTADRFAATGDLRLEIWRDGWFATQRAWPLGIGLGGVQPALIAVERLEILDSQIPNRMHNDYLELALEAGLVGLAILAAIAVLLARLAWQAWRDRPEQRHLTACGLTILAVAAAHSFVDYPLRSMALACLIGTGAGLLVDTPRARAQAGAAADGLDA